MYQKEGLVKHNKGGYFTRCLYPIQEGPTKGPHRVFHDRRQILPRSKGGSEGWSSLEEERIGCGVEEILGDQRSVWVLVHSYCHQRMKEMCGWRKIKITIRYMMGHGRIGVLNGN